MTIPNARGTVTTPAAPDSTSFGWESYLSSGLSSLGFSKQGGIRTVIAGDSYTFLSSAVDKTGGVTFNYNSDTGKSWYVPGAGAFASTADYGAFTWADALMGAPHNLISNAGVGGDDTDLLLARYQTDVIDLAPELIYLWIGRNDFNNNKTFEYVRDNLLKLLAMNDSINAFTCLIDVPPSATIAATPSKAYASVKFNRWLQTLEATRRNVKVVSCSAVQVNPDVAQAGTAFTTYRLTDTTHDNNLGAYKTGQAIADAMSPLLRQWTNYPTSPIEGYDASTSDTTREIRNSNPLMALTGGVANTGVTGDVATGYGCGRTAGTPTVVASKVTEIDSVGEAQRLAITFGAANDGVYLGILNGTDPLSGNASARFVPGRLMEAQCDLTFSADTEAVINRMELVVSGTFGGVAFNTAAMRRVLSSSDQGIGDNIQPLSLAGKTFRLRTPRFLTSSSCTLLQYFVRLACSGAGAVTVDISKFTIRQFPA